MVAACAKEQPPVAAETPAVEPARIDAQRLSGHVRILASDAFQGRAPGTPGEEKTVAYLIEQFEAIGIEPGGPDGNWTQTVPMIHTLLNEEGSLRISHGGDSYPLRQPADIEISTVRSDPALVVDKAPMVFVGYGVSAPERDWDDFGDIDLGGKIALFLVN
ncbi:MAG: hypothetical protein RLP45_05170, partial [Haliea sp.]